MTKEKAIELVDTGLGQALAAFFQNSAAVLVSGSSKGDEEARLLMGLKAYFWAHKRAVEAIEAGKLDGIS